MGKFLEEGSKIVLTTPSEIVSTVAKAEKKSTKWRMLGADL